MTADAHQCSLLIVEFDLQPVLGLGGLRNGGRCVGTDFSARQHGHALPATVPLRQDLDTFGFTVPFDAVVQRIPFSFEAVPYYFARTSHTLPKDGSLVDILYGE